MSNCQKCNSKRIADIQAKHSDCFNISIGNREHDGYAPEIPNVCGGDYTRFELYLDCGQVQGKFPIDPLDMENESDKNSDEDVENFFDQYFVEGDFLTKTFYLHSKAKLIENALDQISSKFANWLQEFFLNNQKVPSKEKFIEMFKSDDY
jgi:hypothetical protein